MNHLRVEINSWTVSPTFAEQRSKYSLSRSSNGITIGYELKGVPREHYIDFERVPVGGLMQWMCYGSDSKATITGTFVIDMIRGMENMSGKMLTQTQAEAVALHASKKMMYSQSALYLSIGGGAAIAWRGRKEMKFPFVKAKPLEAYSTFPGPQLAILQGQYARTMWHITRSMVWIGIGVFAVGPLMNAMGMSSFTVGLYRDDRTKEVMKTIGNQDRLSRVDSNMTQNAAPGKTSPADDAYTRDDGSPSAFSDPGPGSSGNIDGANYNSSSFEQSYYNDDADSTRNVTQQTQPQQRSQGMSSQPAQNQGSDFFFDDASPTAGNDPDMGSRAPHQRSGSAWDRIRGTRPNQPQRQPLPSRLPPKEQEESFSFSSNDAEKGVAKQQAQKEFDAMLEKERKESGSGDYDKGSQAAQYGQETPGAGDSGSAWGRRRGN